MSKHTPGPWVVTHESGSQLGIRAGADSGKPIATITKWTSGSERHDARLIVAAVNAVEGIPTVALEAGVVKELIDALDLAVFALEGKREDDDHTLRTIRAALKKARGE